jgi:hypothetical protein
MTYVLAILTIIAGSAFAAPAQAQQDRWCAVYGGSHGGRNCGFATLEQCRATISGDNTATCERSFYDDQRRRR